eukprot:9066691-Ditylum_brightwellii.AAC.1
MRNGVIPQVGIEKSNVYLLDKEKKQALSTRSIQRLLVEEDYVSQKKKTKKENYNQRFSDDGYINKELRDGKWKPL